MRGLASHPCTPSLTSKKFRIGYSNKKLKFGFADSVVVPND